MGWLQQTMEPVPPLVTMNSELHLEQIYLLPVSLVTCLLPNLEVNNRHQLPMNQGNCHYKQRSNGIQLGWALTQGRHGKMLAITRLGRHRV